MVLRRLTIGVALAASVLFSGVLALTLRTPSLIEGIIWQPTNDYPIPQGQWHWLGANTLLVQWTLNDDQAWVPTPLFDSQPALPNWAQLRQKPWAQHIIMGLASRMKLDSARNDWVLLAHQGARLQASIDKQFSVDGWYAPIEISPDWQQPDVHRRYLAHLPRPRYVSAYGGYGMSPQEFASWVDSWLPDDAKILLQDGVGAAGQTPQQARARADALTEILGESRVIMVLEAFQLDDAGTFGSANLAQLSAQLRAYRGLPIYVFSARHLTTYQVVTLRLLAPWLKD